MSAHRTRWWFMGLSAAPVLATAFYLVQLEPAAVPVGEGVSRNAGIDGPFMARQLERLRGARGFLPCPRETEAKRVGLCVEADEVGTGLLLGDVPRAALGPHAVEDAAPEGWRYLVDLSGTVADFCALSLHGPLRFHGRSVAAALLPPEDAAWAPPPAGKAASVELPETAVPVEACAEPAPARPTHAEGLNAQNLAWSAGPGGKPRPLPEGFDPGALPPLTDPSGLIMLYPSDHGAALQWRIWDMAGERWLNLGRWHVPSGWRLARFALAGDHVIAALDGVDNGHATQLADIPLWAHRRPVRLIPGPQPHAAWQALMAPGEGHVVRAVQSDGTVLNAALDADWPIKDRIPPWAVDKGLRILEGRNADAWLDWRESKPGLRLWRRDAEHAWHATMLGTGKAMPQHALFLSGPERLLVQVKEKTAVRWMGMAAGCGTDAARAGRIAESGHGNSFMGGTVIQCAHVSTTCPHTRHPARSRRIPCQDNSEILRLRAG